MNPQTLSSILPQPKHSVTFKEQQVLLIMQQNCLGLSSMPSRTTHRGTFGCDAPYRRERRTSKSVTKDCWKINLFYGHGLVRFRQKKQLGKIKRRIGVVHTLMILWNMTHSSRYTSKPDMLFLTLQCLWCGTKHICVIF